MDLINVNNLLESNGLTFKQNNLKIEHKIPIGTLVEVNCDYIDEHGVRMFICGHERDCDGSPLYSLYHSKNMDNLNWIRDNDKNGVYRFMISSGFSEEILKIV